MRELREISFKLAIVLAVCTFLGLAWNSTASAQITIKMGSYDTVLELSLDKTNGEFASTNIKAQIFKRIIEDTTQGRIKVDVFPAGQLGGDREVLEMVKQGSVQISAYPGNPLSNFAPEVLALQIPYVFRDINVAQRVVDGPIGKELENLIAKKAGFRVLQWGFEGPYYNFMTAKKQVKVPSDLKGLKIRTMETPSMMEVVKLSGATPTPISWTEVYTSLQQGVVDGIETALPYVRMIRAEEILKHINVANFYLGWSNFYINEKFWQSLSAQDKVMVKDAALQAMSGFKGLTIWGEGLWVDFFRKKNIDVYFPTPAEAKIWENTLKTPMIEWTKKQIGATWVDKIMKASAQAEKEIYGP